MKGARMGKAAVDVVARVFSFFTTTSAHPSAVLYALTHLSAVAAGEIVVSKSAFLAFLLLFFLLRLLFSCCPPPVFLVFLVFIFMCLQIFHC